MKINELRRQTAHLRDYTSNRNDNNSNSRIFGYLCCCESRKDQVKNKGECGQRLIDNLLIL